MEGIREKLIDAALDADHMVVTATHVSSEVQSGTIQCPRDHCNEVFSRDRLKSMALQNVHKSQGGSMTTGIHVSSAIEFVCPRCGSLITAVARISAPVSR